MLKTLTTMVLSPDHAIALWVRKRGIVIVLYHSLTRWNVRNWVVDIRQGEGSERSWFYCVVGRIVEGLRCTVGIVFGEICQVLPPKKDKYLGAMKVSRWVLQKIQGLRRETMKEKERENHVTGRCFYYSHASRYVSKLTMGFHMFHSFRAMSEYVHR